MEIPFLFDFDKSALKDSEPKPDLNDYDSFKKYWNKLLKNAPLKSTDKNDFITMLNIIYEDQYLSHFKEEYNYSESDEYVMTDDEYLKEYGCKGDLDVKDVKNLEKQKYVSFSIENLKEGLMSKEYPFIERKKVSYELCGREKRYFYGRYLIFDPVNNFCSFYPLNNIFDNYIYGLKKDQARSYK